MRKWQMLPAVLAGALLLGQAIPALAAPGMPPFGPRHFGVEPHGPWAPVAIGLFLFLRVLVVLGIAVLIWRLVGAGGLWHRPDSAKQILRERYARGEIGEEEYRKRFETLS